MSSANPNPASHDQDLEQQLDELLSQLATVDPRATADAEEDDTAIDPVDGEAVEISDTHPEDELASQIQEMLDDASSADPADAPEDALLVAPPPVPAAPQQRAAEAPSLDAEVPIQAIDEMLAEAADDAVTGEFETIDQVLATQETPPSASAPAPPPTPAVAAAPPPAPSADVSTPPAGDGHDDDALEGHFESPEQLLAASTDASAEVTAPPTAEVASTLDGSAAAVAAELNDATPADPAPVAQPAQARKLTAPRPGAIIVVCERGLRRVMGTINRPLDAVSPATRSLVGWLGVVTLFNGGAMLVYSVLHAM